MTASKFQYARICEEHPVRNTQYAIRDSRYAIHDTHYALLNPSEIIQYQLRLRFADNIFNQLFRRFLYFLHGFQLR
jgi:hypothetical protein